MTIPKQLLLGELAFASADASAQIPYKRSKFDPATIETRDGDLLRVIRLRGVPFDTADEADIDAWKHQRHHAFRVLAHPSMSLWTHAIRRELTTYPGGNMPSGYALDLDERWRSRWSRQRFFTNEFYLTLVKRNPRMTPVGVGGVIDRVFRGGRDAQRAASAAQVRAHADLVQRSEQLIGQLSLYGATLLQPDKAGIHPALSFLGLLINGEHQPIALPLRDLSKALAWTETAIGSTEIRLRDRVGDCRYASMVSVFDYPPATLPGMIESLLEIPNELVISQSFAYEAQGNSRTELSRQEKRYAQVQDDASSLADELSTARDAVARGALVFGKHQLTVQALVRDRDALHDATGEVISRLAKVGIVGFRERRGLEPAWWSRLPGNSRFCARAVPITSANLASLASFHGMPEGQAEGNHWGPAISALSTTAGTPFFFNFHVGDVGHTVIIGGTGSGKTTLQCFLLAQAQRVRPRAWVFDKKRGAELALRAIGATYTVIRAGSPTGWNPFQLSDSPTTRSFLTDLMISCAYAAGESIPPEAREEISSAVGGTMQLAPEDRRLSEMAAWISKRPGDDTLWKRLQPWHGKGSLAWVFDNASDSLEFSTGSAGFDMTTLLDDVAVCGPALAYLFERVARSLRSGDGIPTIIAVEEARHFLRHDVFADRMEDWALTIRSMGGMLLLSTQKASHLLESKAGQALLESSATQIIFPNPRADKSELTEGWNLTNREAQIVMETARGSRAFLVRSLDTSVVVRLDLGDMPDDIAVLSGTDESVKVCERIREQVGDAPARWLPLFLDAMRSRSLSAPVSPERVA
jgi:type IV secretion system protein VirB4